MEKIEKSFLFFDIETIEDPDREEERAPGAQG